jgi:UDP-N-acetyl-D-mannosaminuronic acid transferase (WecB/TagA/CpsF family)
MTDAATQKSFTDRRSGSRHVWFLNSAFDKIGLDTALRRVDERDPKRPFAFVVTPNVDHLVRLETDTVLATLYAQAWMTVCDSRVLELIGRLSGEQIDLAPGSDLTARLFEEIIDPEETLTIIGGTDSVIDAVKTRYGLKDVRWHEPPMGLRENPDALADAARFVAENPARFTLICVGSPQQEMIAASTGAIARGSGCAWVRRSIFSGGRHNARRPGFKMLDWSGCIAWSRNRRVCGAVIWLTAPKCSFCGLVGARHRLSSGRSRNSFPGLKKCVSETCTSGSARLRNSSPSGPEQSVEIIDIPRGRHSLRRVMVPERA